MTNLLDIFNTILAANPVADIVVNKHLPGTSGSGKGPFTRDSLYERLLAWQENWEGDNGERFEFYEVDRRDGFAIQCPGNLPGMGWPDGEMHNDFHDVNVASLVWVEDGWPRFKCCHNHCGEGAAHGKKTWLSLQNFYDPNREFHRILDDDSDDFMKKWEVEYLDDGFIAEEATIDEVMAATSVEPSRITGSPVSNIYEGLEEVTFTKESPEVPLSKDVEFYKETISNTVTMSDGRTLDKPKQTEAKVEAKVEAAEQHEAVAEPVVKRAYEMPESVMYGWLGTKARELQTPLGFAYPAILTVFAAGLQPLNNIQVRPTLYTCLIGPVHCGKSVSVDRAIKSLTYSDPETVKWTVPGSDRGLINIFGGKKKKKDEDKNNDGLPEFAKTRLLAQDELRNTISKANISGSSLPATLCSLWGQDEAGAADKTGEHVALVRLNLLGALKAEDAEDFAEVFGKESTAGLYDRFIWGVAPRGWEYTDGWDANPEVRFGKNAAIPAHCFEMVRQWRAVDPRVRGRLGELALRVAYITASANHDSKISVECMQKALEFVEWQEAIRCTYKAGMGDALDAICTNAILTTLERNPTKWIKWREVAAKKGWYRKYGASLLGRVRESLAKTGITIEETEDGDNGRPKRTGRIRLRRDTDMS